MPHKPGIRNVGLDVIDQIFEVGFVGGRHSGLSADLLQAHNIPFFVPQGFVQSGSLKFSLDPADNLAVIVVALVGQGIVNMTLKRTTANVHIAYDKDLSVLCRNFVEVLLNGILRKAVSYGQYSQGVLSH